MPDVRSLTPASAADIAGLRDQYRAEMRCQIVHDSIHRRPGWTKPWKIRLGETEVGFGSIAVAGPWLNRPTLFEFYLIPEARHDAADTLAQLVAESGAQFVETQTNDLVLGPLISSVAPAAVCEKIIFADDRTTSLPANGATLKRVTTPGQDQICVQERNGSSEWHLMLNGTEIGRGGVAFHYNRPYGDVYMEVAETYRRRGFGSYFIQELKRICRELDGIPAARVSPDNEASFRCCERAGFKPCARLLSGPIDFAR